MTVWMTVWMTVNDGKISLTVIHITRVNDGNDGNDGIFF